MTAIPMPESRRTHDRIAYYNEHNPQKAAWLRELIRRDLIAPGDVDERDMRDVVPAELVRYTQCHFFAGIGVGIRGDGHGSLGETTPGVQGADGERQRVRPDAQPSGDLVGGHRRPGPTNGFWRDADWLRCRDVDPRSGAQRWRPVKPGTFPLARGAPACVVRGGDHGDAVDAGSSEARTIRLAGYGDAIVAQAAEAFLRAHLEGSQP